MKRKSKFFTFIVSFFPGLGQVYLGFRARGLAFMGAFFGLCFFIGFLHEVLHLHDSAIFLGLLPVIWLIAMVDSMILVDRINKICLGQIVIEEGDKNMQLYSNEEMKKQNKKIISMLLSIVPGAGHMYIGFQKLGLQLMTIFFFSLFFIDWIDISALMFIIPIVWFYSLFDVMHKVSDSDSIPVKDEDAIFITWFNKNGSMIEKRNKYIGWVMVTLGIILIFNKLAFPIIHTYMHINMYVFKQYLETGVVAFILIIGGIKLLIGSKSAQNCEEDAESYNDEE